MGRRSRRSYVVELVLVVVGVALIFAAVNLRWVDAFGRWIAEQFAR